MKWRKLDKESDSWFIACSYGLACIRGQLERSSLAGIESLSRDVPSDSLRFPLCDSSTPPLVFLHTLLFLSGFTPVLHTSWESSTGHNVLQRFWSLLIIWIPSCEILRTFPELRSCWAKVWEWLMVFLHFIIKKLFKKRTARVLLRLAAGKWVLFTCVRKEGKKEGRREHLSLSLPSLE